MPLSLIGLAKAYDRATPLRDVTVDIADGEFLALLGPSGSGKTTLLRILAGLTRPTGGQAIADGQDLLALAPRARRAGMVFQHYALFRHMTVAGNIGFGLRVRPRRERPSREAIRARTEDLLRLVQLEGFGGRFPAQLSGGQQQRVALARALAIEPKLLLLDEPFGALDARVRRELRQWLRRVHDETGVTTIFVTHDQEEALDIADRVAVLNDGRIEQVGPPAEVYDNPATPFVYSFMGPANALPGALSGGRLSILGVEVAAPADAPDGPVTAYFRPYDVELTPRGFPARVQAVVRRGASIRLEATTEAGPITLDLPAATTTAPSRGQDIRIAPNRVRLFERRL